RPSSVAAVSLSTKTSTWRSRNQWISEGTTSRTSAFFGLDVIPTFLMPMTYLTRFGSLRISRPAPRPRTCSEPLAMRPAILAGVRVALRHPQGHVNVMLSAAKHPSHFFSTQCGMLRCAQHDISGQVAEKLVATETARDGLS